MLLDVTGAAEVETCNKRANSITENTKEVQDAVGKDLKVIGVLLAPNCDRRVGDAAAVVQGAAARDLLGGL